MNLTLHSFNSTSIGQRSEDGYVNATAMCQANGKRFNDYFRLDTTQEFLIALERSAGIPADLLISKIATGKNENRGTWVHPYVAINLGQWCSPEFAVFVSKLVFTWMNGTASVPKPDRILELELQVQIESLRLEQLRLTAKGSDQSASKVSKAGKSKATANSIEAQESVRQFVDYCLRPSVDASPLQNQTLYEAYKSFCLNCGHQRIGSHRFIFYLKKVLPFCHVERGRVLAKDNPDRPWIPAHWQGIEILFDVFELGGLAAFAPRLRIV